MPSSKEQFGAAVLRICNQISITPFHRAFVASLCMPSYKHDLPIVPVDIAYMFAEMTPIKKLSDLEVLDDNDCFKVYRLNSEFYLKIEEGQHLIFTFIESNNEYSITFFVNDDGTTRVIEGRFREEDGTDEIMAVRIPGRVPHRDLVPNQPMDRDTVSYTYIDGSVQIAITGMSIVGLERVALGNSETEHAPRIELPHGPIYQPDLLQDWLYDHPYVRSEYGYPIFINLDIVVVDGELGSEIAIDVTVDRDNSGPVKLDPSFEHWHAVKELADSVLGELGAPP